MRLLFTICCFLLIFAGCKKAIEKAQDDIIIASMTDGEWKVTSFISNSVNLTADFSPYVFKYHSNKTVDAIKNGSFEIKGNWDGSIATRSTWAEFVGASSTLMLLNGTWNITNNTWTYVVATQNVGGELRSMRLEKL